MLGNLTSTDIEEIDAYYATLKFNSTDPLWEMDRKIQISEQNDILNAIMNKTTRFLTTKMKIYREIYEFSMNNTICRLMFIHY
jgi:hypothetical protein